MGILIVIVVVFVLMFGVAGWVAIAWSISDSQKQKKAQENAPAILDQAFTGEDVVFKIGARSPKYETVVLGAKARGYRLMNETNDTADGGAKTLMFERIV